MTEPDDPFAPPPERAGSAPQPGPEGAGYGQAPAYGQAPGYGQAPLYGAPVTGRRNGFGIAALVLGILSLPAVFTIIFGILLGLLAIVFGVLGRRRATRGEADNGGLALAGLILGALSLVASLAFVAVGVAFFTSGSGRQVRDCLDRAGTDQAAVQRCQTDLQHRVTGN